MNKAQLIDLPNEEFNALEAQQLRSQQYPNRETHHEVCQLEIFNIFEKGRYSILERNKYNPDILISF